MSTTGNADRPNDPGTFRDRNSDVTKDGKRKWVYALQPSGRFYRFRNYCSWLYFLLFFTLPFIRVNGMPFVLLNFPQAKFIVFSKIFWPQDFFILAVGMITFIVLIALFTAVYGRLFCGWICPQTIFMEMMFRKIEWLIEGSPQQQRKLAERDWDTDKLLRRITKHVVFLLLSFLIANTFLAYIIGVEDLLLMMREPAKEHLGLLSGLLFFTLLFYAVFAFVRDVVCTTICPYGRLQGVLFDKDTMQVSYDYRRGELRGKLRKNETQQTGDCVDCHKCVQVCPTGIDIRNGVQMECVGCTACIDACDEVMRKLQLPEGLIRYASENEIAKGRKFHFNTKMKAYTLSIILLTSLLAVLILTRRSVDTYVSRVKGQLYQELPSGELSNLFTAKVINKTNEQFPVEFRIEGMAGTIQMVGTHGMLLKKEAVSECPFFIILDKKALRQRNTKVSIGVYRAGKKIQTISTTFLGPFI